MKRKHGKHKARSGLIVRSTSFQHLKREPPITRKRRTFQKKLGKDRYEVVTYRNHTKIVTTVSIVKDKVEAKAIFQKDYKRFERTKGLKDFGGSVQMFSGRIKTVRLGMVHIAGKVTKSSHLYSISKKGTRKKDRQAIIHNKLIDTFNALDSFTFEQYR